MGILALTAMSAPSAQAISIIGPPVQDLSELWTVKTVDGAQYLSPNYPMHGLTTGGFRVQPDGSLSVTNDLKLTFGATGGFMRGNDIGTEINANRKQLTIKSGPLSIESTTASIVSPSLDVYAKSNFYQPMIIANDLTVQKASIFKGTTTTEGTASFAKAVTMQEGLQVTGDVSVSGTIYAAHVITNDPQPDVTGMVTTDGTSTYMQSGKVTVSGNGIPGLPAYSARVYFPAPFKSGTKPVMQFTTELPSPSQQYLVPAVAMVAGGNNTYFDVALVNNEYQGVKKTMIVNWVAIGQKPTTAQAIMKLPVKTDVITR